MKKQSRRNAATMYPLVKQWQGSSQSKGDFCRNHQINLHTFTYWIQKYRKEQGQSCCSSFVALEVPAPPVLPGQTYLRYPNGVELHFAQLPPATALADLLKITL